MGEGPTETIALASTADRRLLTDLRQTPSGQRWLREARILAGLSPHNEFVDVLLVQGFDDEILRHRVLFEATLPYPYREMIFR